jgi:hypothetical protein
LSKYQVLGLSATSQDSIQAIIEDVIFSEGELHMVDFKSEYEMVSGNSHLNGVIEMLPKDADIVHHIAEKCKETYSSKPLICILEEAEQLKMKTELATEGFNFYDTNDLRELPNYNRGILMLTKKQYKGLNS